MGNNVYQNQIQQQQQKNKEKKRQIFILGGNGSFLREKR